MQVKWDVYSLSLLPNCHVNEANVNEANLTFRVWTTQQLECAIRTRATAPTAPSPLYLQIVVMNGEAQPGSKEADMGRCPAGSLGHQPDKQQLQSVVS